MPRKRKIVIPKATSTYEYFNANPSGKQVNDCAIRCLALALNKSWDDAFDILAKKSKDKKLPMDDLDSIKEVLEENGYKRISIKVIKGVKRPTMNGLIPHYQDCIIIGQCSQHIMAAFDGKVRDIWNTSKKPLYAYWIKEIDYEEYRKNTPFTELT